jgi:insecticidal toxin complex protein TccC
LQKLTYRYDPFGNITEITDAALPIQHFANQRIEPVRRFTYDTLYQLISATGWETAKPSLGPALPGWQGFGPPDASRWCNYTETYYYDEAGNLLQRLHHGAVDDTLTMRVASHSNRSVKTRSGQPGIDELFDARGNLLELQPGQALQWNGRNQLAQVTQVARIEGADDIERYVYDSEGARLRKYREVTAKSIVHTPEVRYLPGIELHANSATGERLQVISVQAGRCSVRLLHWDSPPPAGLDNDQWRYCFDDHLGSSAFEVDAQAKTISQEVYYPFGGTAWLAGRHEVETSYKTIRYSGKERDATGLYYYGARYYAPWLQRWLNPDPAGDVDGLNFYRFVRSSPVNFVDQIGCNSLFAFINDFRVERDKGLRHMVEQRGMKNIRKNLPEVADLLIEAFSRAKDVLENVVAELEGGDFNSDIIKSYFGTISSDDTEYLIKGYRGLLSDMEHIEKKTGKVVIFAGVGELVDTEALVNHNDRRRKIYFNSLRVKAGTDESVGSIIIHELSHRNLLFKSKDYWYSAIPIYENQYRASSSNPQFSLMDAMQHVGTEAISKKLMGGVVEESDIDRSLKQKFILGAGASNLDEAMHKFRNSPRIRTDMALANADTLAAFAGAMSRYREDRKTAP